MQYPLGGRRPPPPLPHPPCEPVPHGGALLVNEHQGDVGKHLGGGRECHGKEAATHVLLGNMQAGSSHVGLYVVKVRTCAGTIGTSMEGASGNIIDKDGGIAKACRRVGMCDHTYAHTCTSHAVAPQREGDVS